MLPHVILSPSNLRWLLISSILLWGMAPAQPEIGESRAGFSGSVIGDDVLYSIGGGSAVPMGPGANMQSLGVGAGWRSNLICGDMSLETTLQNQLNGLTNGFQSIMSSVIQNATNAVASLPALIIQRANPGLYNLLTNGILQARLDFDRSKSTCRAIANRMADIAGGQSGWDQLAEGMALKEATNKTDAVAAIEQTEARRGNRGVPWVGGDQAGGSGQVPIKVVSDVTRAGYNLLNGRGVTDTSPIPRANCSDRLSCLSWPSPQAAADWANRVLGEQVQRTCDGCSKTDSTPGTGLTPLIQEEYESKLRALQDLITQRVPTTPTNLEAAGSNALPVTRGLIEALREEPDQDLLGKRLASEAALSSVLEKALLLQRTLLTGRQEPNVAANELAQQAVTQESELLSLEIQNLKTELELRRTLAANTASEILRRNQSRVEGSRGIYQGDPERNRIEQIERPTEEDASMRGTWIRRLSTVARIAVWTSALTLTGILINILAIRLLGDAQTPRHWLDEHATGLLIWRLCLYVMLICSWCWMRARLSQHQPEATQRLHRAEWAGIAALALLEASNALSGPEAP